jgi:hypothetical protein
MAKYQITTDELDFDLVKANIKEFFRSQAVFTDYDFDGSALSVLIDLLAYNTLYNSFYNHLTVNEMFLDSASKYASAVSLAKTIGYTPKSAKAARSVLSVNISGVPENPTVLTLPSGTIFRATVGDREFDFQTMTDYTTTNNLGNFLFEDITVAEGAGLSKRYGVADNIKYVIPNKDVDLSTLEVFVQENASSSSYTKYTKVDDILNVKSTDNVFFLKQREDTLYEVYFGNGVLGSSLSTGNLVVLEYMLTSGSVANGARSFVYSSGFRSDVFYTINTSQIALGGDEAETLESIKFNAPRMYVAQNRAVSAEDYDVLLRERFTNIESLSIWGGQDNIPPVYGKVFITAKPTDRESFLSDEKQEMISYLTSGKNIATITPVFLDPEFLRLQIVTNVYYNKNLSRKTPGELATLVRNTILSYGDDLDRFGNSFRFSQLSTEIDNSDASIISNISSIKIRKVIQPVYNITTKYTVRLENPIYQDRDTGETIWSTRFYIGAESDRCYFKDDGAGNIDLYLENTLGEARFYKTIGTVNYSTGVIEIIDVLIRGLYDQEIEVMCTPLSNDVIPIRQYLISIPPELIEVNIIADTESASGVKQKHTFSSSR